MSKSNEFLKEVENEENELELNKDDFVKQEGAVVSAIAEEENELNNEDENYTEPKNKPLDLDSFIPAVTSSFNNRSEEGVLSVVNSKNGMQLRFAKEFHNSLGSPENFQIGYSDTELAVGKDLGQHFTSYPLKDNGLKKIIYSSELVKQITEIYDLDFSDRTCITFSEVTYHQVRGNTVALIKMKDNNE